ncbi:MAG: DUF748 domain-containing protein [Thiohalophilus sp.]|jgi:hypothetical protein
MSETIQKKRWPRGLKYAGGLLAALILLLALAVAFVSPIARWMVVYTLKKEGYQASIAQLDLDLRKARLIGNNIKLEQGKNKFDLKKLEMGFDWQALREHRLSLIDLNLKGLKIDWSTQSVHPEDKADPALSKQHQKGWLVGLRSFTLQDSEFCLVDQQSKPCVTVDRLNWQGKTQFDTATADQPLKTLPFELNGALAVNDLALAYRDQSPLLSWKQLSVKNLQIKSLSDIRLAQLQLQQLVLSRQTGNEGQQTSNPYTQFDSLTSDQISIVDLKRIDVGNVVLTGLGLNVVRQQNGEWEAPGHLALLMGTASTESAAQKPAKTGKSLAFSVKHLSIEQSGQITFEDRAFATPSILSLDELAFSISDLDSTQPDRPSPFSFSSKVNQYGMLELEGSVHPLKSIPNFDIRGSATGIDLRTTSQYLERYLGYKVKSGQLNGELTLAAESGKLNGVANVELQQFVLLEVDQDKAEALTGQNGTTLKATLALLREKDKSIRLQIPIHGDMMDPQFNTNDAFKQILNKSIMQAIESYYTDYGLTMVGYGQYGLAITGAMKLFEFLNKLRFEPVIFNAGQQQLGDEQKTYLDKLVKMLNERPKVHLSFCGFATVADLWLQDGGLASEPEEKWQLSSLTDTQRESLMQLANQRALAIKEYLVKEQSIDAKRLIICEPQYTPATDKLPRVEISL